MVRMTVEFFGHNRMKRSVRLTVTKSVGAVDVAVQQLGYHVVNGLQQVLERAYSSIRVPCTVALTHVLR